MVYFPLCCTDTLHTQGFRRGCKCLTQARLLFARDNTRSPALHQCLND